MAAIGSMEQYLEVQLKNWNRRNDIQNNCSKGPVITITREPGCCGEAIAQKLARELGMELHDWAVVEEIARDSNVSEQVVATLDTEVRSELDDWLASFSPNTGLTSYHYSQCLRKVLFTIATHGNAVILGRGGNFLLPPEKKTIGLCFVAPLEHRVINTMQALGLSREDSLKHVTETEKEQRHWIKKFGHADITDATNYHMVINTALTTPDTILHLVREMLTTHSWIPTRALPRPGVENEGG